MLKLKLPMLSSLLLLSACATTTPIAVATKQWVVPPPPPQLQAVEQAALQEATTSLQAWNKWLSDLPVPSPTRPSL